MHQLTRYASAEGSVTISFTRLADNRLAAVEVKPPPPPPPPSTPQSPLQHCATAKSRKSHYNKRSHGDNGLGEDDNDDADSYCGDVVEGSGVPRGSDNSTIGGGGGRYYCRCVMGAGNVMEGNGVDGVLEQG